jgi:hypothetical protein
LASPTFCRLWSIARRPPNVAVGHAERQAHEQPVLGLGPRALVGPGLQPVPAGVDGVDGPPQLAGRLGGRQGGNEPVVGVGPGAAAHGESSRHLAGLDKLTPEQAQKNHDAIGPTLGYLARLLERMDRMNLRLRDQKLYGLVRAAEGAIHSLSVEWHYQSCGYGAGAGQMTVPD